MEPFKTITDLAAVTGGVNWPAVHQQGLQTQAWMQDVARNSNSVDRGMAWAGGYVGGAVKGIFNTWGE